MNSSQPQPDPRPGPFGRLCGTFKTLAVLAVLGGAVFVAAKYYCADRLNEEIRLRVESQLREHYRGMAVSLYSARRLAGRGVELRGLAIRDGQDADSPVLVHIDEVFAECDTRLPDFITMPPRITRMHFQRLKLRAERQPDGCWNLARLLPLPGMGQGGPAPTTTISDSVVEIVDPTSAEATPLALRNIELIVKPEDPAVLRIQGSLAGDHLERVEIDGVLDPRSAAWEVRGAVEGLEFNPRLRTALPHEIATLLAPLSTVRGRTYLGFHVKRHGSPHAPREETVTRSVTPTMSSLEFVISGKISEGRIDDARLPEPLSDVEATIRADNHGIVIQDLSARCGSTNLEIDAEIFGYSPGSPLKLDVVARQLEVQRLPVQSLPPQVQKVYADFSPLGRVDLTAHLTFDGQRWQPDIVIKCHDLAIQYVRFPYRLVGGTGSIELKHDHLSAQLRMLTGSQVVHCRAEVDHPGPAFTGWVEVESEGPVPVDEKLLAALEPKYQHIVRAFHPRGLVSIQGRLARETGQQPLDRRLSVTMHDCSIQHDRFSYPIDKVNGSLQLTGSDWQFRHLTGRNDSAYILGGGSWIAAAPDGNQLRLEFTATDVPLADELRQALSPGAQRLWSNLRPRGNIDHLTVGMKYSATRQKFGIDVKGEKWPPGQNVEGRALSIEPIWFRYRMDNLTGSIHYQDGLIDLTGLAAAHGRTTIEADGKAQVLGDGGCRLELKRLAADRLESDADLIAALPPAIGQGLSRLAIEGPINVDGSLAVTVPGKGDQPPALEWNLDFDVDNGRLATPTPVEHVFGGVKLVGGSGPRGAFSRGEVTIDSAEIRGIQFTQVSGPLVLDGQRVLFGVAAERDVQNRVPRPISASALLGQLTANGELLLTPAGEFGLQISLENADLAEVVSELAPRQRGLSGKVFGLVNMGGTLEGAHTWRGAGQIRLRDADIYELPVMIAMLKLLSIQRPDRTAFNTSNIDFRIEGDDLALDRIDFNGDAICLKGKGRMTGQREVDLKFYPQFGRDEFQLPIFRPLVSETSRQLMLIEVTGTLDRPRVERYAFPNLDERLAELFPELATRQATRDQPPPVFSLPKLWRR
ncbi:MAG: AsmA-like C-terminal region-containing protein [Planctomycetaceae bacterium]|nr:AsmA-like C-terminal region-containing protein [Planctomycetaceae bacterium]